MPKPPSPERLKKELKYIKERKRELRKNSTPTERRMWEKLRAKRFHGYKWRRQYNVGDWYLDFYCPELKLGIELNGGVHYSPEAHENDVARTRALNKLGIKLLHFSNIQILRDWESVEERILEELRKNPTDSSSTI